MTLELAAPSVAFKVRLVCLTVSLSNMRVGSRWRPRGSLLGGPLSIGRLQLGRLKDRLGLHQIDSVNVVSRAHYLPAFSRLGAYDRGLLDSMAWGRKRERRLFEYWAHEASLLPLELHPLFRWRMARGDRGEVGYAGMRRFATERRPEALAILDRIRNEGPLAASDFPDGKSRPGWWEWGGTKRALGSNAP